MLITVECVMQLNPCEDYPRSRIEALVGEGLDPAAESTFERISALPPADARWVLSRLLDLDNRVKWAKATAGRAADYAQYSVSAARAAGYASGYAARAARAARAASAADSAVAASSSAACTARAASAADSARAADYAQYSASAASAADRATEHGIAIRHALTLLAGQA